MSGIRHLSAFFICLRILRRKINCLIQETYKKQKKHTRGQTLLSEQGICFFAKTVFSGIILALYKSKAEQAPKQSIVP